VSAAASHGCGTWAAGRVTSPRFLAGLGVRAAGIDLSGEMIGQDAKRHPGLEFSTGSMTALPAAGASWDGLVSFYSLIHMIDDADVRAALAEWFGAGVDVSFRFFDPAWLGAELERAGFAVESLTRREPYPGAEVATPARLLSDPRRMTRAPRRPSPSGR